MGTVVHRRDSVGALHRLDPFAGRPVAEPEVWWCDFADDAIVLGSRQTDAVLDVAACRRAGLRIERRRSGGGAVLLRPDAVVWIDAVLPHGLAPDDVRGAMGWIGERWLDAVAPFTAPGAELTVHRGGMVATAWSDLVCFAGVGPGEVLTDGRKLVGLSQRRTRDGLRIQGLVHRRSLVHEMPGLFAVSSPAGPVAPGSVPAGPVPVPGELPELDPVIVANRLAALLQTR